MNKMFLLCVITLLFRPSLGLSSTSSDLSEKLEKIIKHSGLKKEDLGVQVSDSDGNSIFEVNSSKRFIPASISKLITASAALNAFTPNYKFHTQVLVDGEQIGGLVKGNIYLKGMGDPAFVSEKMWMMVNELTRTGIKKITGQIIADDSFFDSERFDPGREADRNDRAYDAPIGALSFDWNATTIYVRPGLKPGAKADVWVDPVNDYITLKSEVTTAHQNSDLEASRVTNDGKDTLVVHGKIAEGATEKHIYKNISNPPLYAAYNFREFLKQRGIEVTGTEALGSAPSSAKVVVDFEGEPLSRLVTNMDKFSNNFVAEMLAKSLGAFKTGHQGKMSDGLDEIRSFLKTEMGWDAKDYNLANVSGFTRKNSFSPGQFVQLLSWMQKQFRLFPEFLQSLPVAGIDGTLEKRMKSPPAQGWVRAKTGLLNGVVALAGYAGKKGDGVKIFTFIYNGHGDEAHVRDTFDSLAAGLTQ